MKLKKSFLYKNLIGLVLLLGFAVLGISGKHAYPEFRPILAQEARAILRTHGLPVADNRISPWFRISGIPGSYTVFLYQSDEIPQQAILDIVKLCMNFYEQRGRKERFRVLVYRETVEQERKSMFLGIGVLASIKPFFELTIGEKE